MGAIGLGNKGYVLGGASFSTSVPPCVDDQSAQTWIFDPMGAAGARWQQGPSLNVARGYITPAISGGRIYAIGGDVNQAGTLGAYLAISAYALDNAYDAGVPCVVGQHEHAVVPAFCSLLKRLLNDLHFDVLTLNIVVVEKHCQLRGARTIIGE